MNKMELIWGVPVGERIVSTCLYRDHVIIATETKIYRLVHKETGHDVSVTEIPLEWEEPKDEQN